MEINKVVVELRKKVMVMKDKNKRYYIKPEDVPKYRAMGYNVYRGPRGGLYINLDEQPHTANIKQKVGELGEHARTVVDLFENNNIEGLRNVLNLLIDFENGKITNIEMVYDGIDELRNEIMEKFQNGEVSEDVKNELLGHVDNIEEYLDNKVSDDILHVKAYRIVVRGSRAYAKVVERLGVLSKFDEIDVVQYVGNDDGIDVYMLDMKNSGKFEVGYDANGNVVKLAIIGERGRCDLIENTECLVKWFDRIGRDKIFKMFDAFKEYYGYKEVGNTIVVEIRRVNTEIKQLELRKPFGRRGRTKWMLFLIMAAKKLGIAWQDIGELIHILSRSGLLEMVKEMDHQNFSI